MEVWGYKILEIGHEDVSELIGLDVVALQMAEAGAMGYHGGVFLVTKKSSIYFTCLLKSSSFTGFAKTMSRSDLEKIFPPLADFQHGLLGKDLQVPKGWRHEYLGMGNHLLVKDGYWKRFMKEADRIEKQNPQVILYNIWLQAILAAIKR